MQNEPIFFLHQNPFFRITVGLITGIITAYNFPSVIAGELLVLCATIISVAMLFTDNKRAYALRYMHGIGFMILFVGLGMVLMSTYVPSDGIDTAWASSIRLRLNEIYSRYISAENRGMISALTIGDKSGLTYPMRASFRNAGASHVLAVSGLHTGVVYLTLRKICAIIMPKQIRRHIEAIITIIGLWLYAYICGLPASVVRSALMFSLMAGASIFEARSNSMNAMLFSAFCMLIYNPYYLFDIGFQLSFCAVTSIILIYRPLFNLLTPHTCLGSWAWSMICVSLAAQAGTAPVSIYYFHQFPTYFLLTNIAVVPSASLIIYLTCALLALHGMGSVASAIGWVIDIISGFMLKATSFIASLPASTINDLHITMFGVFCIMTAIVATYIALAYRRGDMILLQLTSIALFLSDEIIGEFDYYNNIISYLTI